MRLANLNMTVEFDEGEIPWPGSRDQLSVYADRILRRAFGDAITNQLEVTQVTPSAFKGSFTVTIAAQQIATP